MSEMLEEKGTTIAVIPLTKLDSYIERAIDKALASKIKLAA